LSYSVFHCAQKPCAAGGLAAEQRRHQWGSLRRSPRPQSGLGECKPHHSPTPWCSLSTYSAQHANWTGSHLVEHRTNRLYWTPNPSPFVR